MTIPSPDERSRPVENRTASQEVPGGADPTIAAPSDIEADPGSPEVYGPRAVKRRRSTKAQMQHFDDALITLIADAGPPVTCRQTYYMAVPKLLVPKLDSGYKKVIRHLSNMRENGKIPWEWIADNTRWVRQATTYVDLDDALSEWQSMYRKDYWQTQPERVELWVESDSIASFLLEIVQRYGLPMYVCKGQASKSYIYAAARAAEALGKPVRILYLGDFDPTGVKIDQSLTQRYGRYGAVDLSIERIGITPRQIIDMSLMGTPAKRKDPNYSSFVRYCADHGLPVEAVETEAMHPVDLRSLVTEAIDSTIDGRAWAAVADYEESERLQLQRFVQGVGR